jgi:hypothetical protein
LPAPTSASTSHIAAVFRVITSSVLVLLTIHVIIITKMQRWLAVAWGSARGNDKTTRVIVSYHVSQHEHSQIGNFEACGLPLSC